MKENLLLIAVAVLVGLLVGVTVTGGTSMSQNSQQEQSMLNMGSNGDMGDMQSNPSGMMGSGMMMGGMDEMMNSHGDENMMAEHMARCREMMDSTMGMMH